MAIAAPVPVMPFTNPARSEEIDFGIRNIDRRNVDGANVSVDGHVIFREVRVNDSPVARVDVRVFCSARHRRGDSNGFITYLEFS